jgi:hypothetical protein
MHRNSRPKKSGFLLEMWKKNRTIIDKTEHYMRETSYTGTVKTACGKTISYYKEDGSVAKAHSTTGPAFVYPKEDKKAPEYYLYGIKYTKTQWQELINQHKASTQLDLGGFDY